MVLYLLACMYTLDDRTGAYGAARPVSEHHADQPLSGLSMKAHSYVQCRDSCVCEICTSVSNVLFVFNVGVATALGRVSRVRSR